MASVSFSYTEPIRQGWRLFKKYWKAMYAYFGVMILYQTVLSVLQGGLEQADQATAAVMSLVVTVVFFVPSWLLQLFGAKLELEVVDEVYTSFSRVLDWLKRNWKLFWQFFVASLVVGLVVAIPIVGLALLTLALSTVDLVWLGVLLLIPGVVFVVYMSVRLQFYQFLIVDRDLKAMDSVKESWEMTEGKVGWLIVFDLVLGLFILAGLLLLFVGMLVTAPVSMLAMTWVYRQFSGGGRPGGMGGTADATEAEMGESPRWHHGSRSPAHQPGEAGAGSPQPMAHGQQGIDQPSPQTGGATSEEVSQEGGVQPEPQQGTGSPGEGDGGHPVYG